MLRKTVFCGVLLTAVFCLLGSFARDVNAQEIKVRVIQVRASNTGKEEVDPSLGSLGERLKRQYRFRNFKKEGTSYQSGKLGDTLNFPLIGGLTLTLVLNGYEDPMISMRATVRRTGTPIMSTDLRVKNGGSMIISAPMARDTLILSISPSLE
jgi:hypothetical protein